MQVFNAWLKDIAEDHKNLKMQFGSPLDKDNFVAKAEKQKYTSFASEAQERSNQKTSECPLENGEHKIWKCNQCNKNGVRERNKTVKRLKLFFCCLKRGCRASQCKLIRSCGKHGCTRKHNRSWGSK